ncbi:hypothetical protein H5410_034339 [Solanum commersonii]|uniref:Uncharacterized protein n=1 Tax=Solanum commersonii TaxID=4109 RepID=A0A9J5YR47_SOLCO|nr:hypothetical protein H5410_034339 [Solanum commersonii]
MLFSISVLRLHYIWYYFSVANTYCSKSENMIRWKIIAVTQLSKYITEGRFIMKLQISNYKIAN